MCIEIHVKGQRPTRAGERLKGQMRMIQFKNGEVGLVTAYCGEKDGEVVTVETQVHFPTAVDDSVLFKNCVKEIIEAHSREILLEA